MGKLEYLDALRRAMAGLSADTQAKTLAYYEQRFIDGVAAGRTEAEVAAELDDPKKIAMTLRASVHMHSFEQKKDPANALRLLVSVVGLGIFNLFMVVPAMVYAALLAALYACGLAFYVAGIAITASGLSGANELVLDGPFRELVLSDASPDEADKLQAKVSISEDGVHFYQEKIPQHAAREAARAAEEAVAAAQEASEAAEQAGVAHDAAETAREAAAAAREAAAEAQEEAQAEAQADSPRKRGVIRRAEEVAGRGIRISTALEPGSRATQTFFGLGMVVGGIVIFLLCLVITKYTLIGIRRYVEMNFSLLKGN